VGLAIGLAEKLHWIAAVAVSLQPNRTMQQTHQTSKLHPVNPATDLWCLVGKLHQKPQVWLLSFPYTLCHNDCIQQQQCNFLWNVVIIYGIKTMELFNILQILPH
jgi:hypothetical protein